MTSPSGGISASRVALASQSLGGDKPSTAVSLANSDLSDSEINMVGGFVRGMGTSLVARMARSSGATTMFTPEERSQLDALGEDYTDIDKSAEAPDPRNFLEKAFDLVGGALSNTGEFLVHNPVTEGVFDAWDTALDAVKLPARILGDALDTDNTDEIHDAMEAKGYDPNSTGDYMAFMFNQGNSQFHDLDGIRERFDNGDEMVDLAMEFFADPEAFNKRRLADPTFDQRAGELMASPDWEHVADLVDRQHISPGRDVARVLTLGHTDNAVFTTLSGALDAAYTLALDPTLVLGKGIRLARAADAASGAINVSGVSRFGMSRGVATLIDRGTGGYYRSGVKNIRDIDGISKLLATDAATGEAKTSIGKGIKAFLDDADSLRAAHKANDIETATAIQARMSSKYPGLMPMLDEVNGRRVVGEAPTRDVTPDRQLADQFGIGWEASRGAPIKTLDEFRQYLMDTTGLLRLSSGVAMKTGIVMPGRVTTRRAIAAKIREARVGRQAAIEAEVFDHTKLGRDTIPLKEEQELLDELDQIPASELMSDSAKRGEIIRNLLNKGTPEGDRRSVIKRARARNDRRVRRLSTLMPTVSSLDLTSSAHAEQVRRFSRLYLSRTESDRLATLWTLGTEAERRSIARGMLDQTYHASGLSASEQGQAFWRRYEADQVELDRQMYGYDGNDVIKTERGDVHVALHLTQLSNRVLLPSFREMQYMASKYNAASWFSRNVGARFYGDAMDASMTAIKMGWITSPAGGLRNAIDELAGLAARGDAKDLLKYRSLYTQVTVANRAKVREDSRAYRALVKEHGEEKTREILGARVAAAGNDLEARRAASLEARIQHRIPLAFRGAADTVNDVILGKTLGQYLSATKQLDGDEIGYLKELTDLQKRGLTSHTISDTFYADDMAGITDNEGALAMAKDGIASTRVKYLPKGWEQVEVDGGAGNDAWAGTLAMKFSNPADPAHVALRHLWDDDAETAVLKVREYLDSDRMKPYVDSMEITTHTKDGRRVTTPEEKAAAFDEYAQRLVADVKLAVTGRGPNEFVPELKERTREWISARSKRREKNPNYVFKGEVTDAHVRKYLKQERGLVLREGEYGEGKIHHDLAFTLLNGGIPDRQWLSTLPDEYKPRYAIKQQFAPVLPGGVVERLAGNWTEFLAKGYKKVVTDQVQALVRNPLFASKYVTARRNVKVYEDHLVEQGWSKEAARNVSVRIAQQHAEQEVIKHIDNPQVASQFSVLARNFWAFERAQEDWMRRWGRIIRDDPTVIRKGQLAVHAGQSAGILHQDDEGNLTFTYPGSGVMIGALNKIASAVGLGSQVNIPVSGDLSSRLTFVNPSLDNPVGFSATPVISVPFKFIASSFGAEYPILLSSMDKVINGEMGAGREWYSQMLPIPIARIVDGAIRTDPGSKFGSAYMQAVANMEAAGKLEDLTGADPGKLDEFHATLQAQIKNNLVASALFGLWAPAAPGIPENSVPGSKAVDADWSWHQQGLESLKAEAQMIFSKLPYEDAMEWWTRNHPGEMIYAPGGGGSTTELGVGSDGASAPASLTAAAWMEGNRDFLKKYPGIGTYFIPQGQAGTKGAEFSQVAYQAQQELGIREKKDLREFLNGVVVSRGERIYYDTKDDYDEAIARAERVGDVNTVRSLEAQWAGEKALIYAGNPLLQAKNATYAENAVHREQQLRDLVRLMNDPHSYQALGGQATGVQALMDAFANYQAGVTRIKGERGNTATRTRVQLRNAYQANVNRITETHPGLADLARGVFRIPA